MSTYDLAILGSGPGGYVAAIRAAQLGMKVALVEAEVLGGVCLNWGCIPTKVLLRNASVLHTIKQASRYGIEVTGIKPDYTQAVERAEAVVSRQTTGLGHLMQKNGITVLNERGRLLARDRIQLTPSGDEIEARHIILATGARSRTLPGLRPDGRVVFTAREALPMRDLPKRMVILGGGPIGCEFAYVWQTYGCHVTLVELEGHLLPKEDPEVSAVVEKAFRKLGVQVLTRTRFIGAEQHDDHVRVTLDGPDGELAFDSPALMIGIGATGNIEDLGLEVVGVETERGFIKVDAHNRTNVPGIDAIGDVTGRYMLAHVASQMGIVSAEQVAGMHPEPVNMDQVPSCTYCEPQVASIGLTEAAARARGLEVKVGKYPFAPNGKAQALGETDGFVKVVIEARYGEILGVHMVGPDVTELIGEVGLGMRLEATAEEIDRTIHAHPTLSEALKEAALAAIGHPIHL